MGHLVILRHGESTWNKENRFTGWVDVELSEKGRAEAQEAGRVLSGTGIEFDETYTSVLTRAIQTHWLTLEQMKRIWLPVKRTWRLNERHYGSLQGLDKSETAAKYGEEQVKIWRRSYDVPPPIMPVDDPNHPKNDLRYKNVAAQVLPGGESLKDTVARVIPFLNESIFPDLKSGKSILIVAHGNSLRALVQYLEKLTPAEIMEVNIPTGVPCHYEIDSSLTVKSKKYLGDAEKIKEAMESVKNQGKKK